MNCIVVINGPPRGGKDTAVELMRKACTREGVYTHAFSSIDCVRYALKTLGIDDTQKTPAWRAAMSEIGDTLERHFDFRSQACVKEITVTLAGRGDAVVFMHMREPGLIKKVADKLRWPVVKVYLDSKYAENVTSNSSDTGTWEEGFYDHVLRNNGTLDEFREECFNFLLKIGVLRQPPLLQ